MKNRKLDCLIVPKKDKEPEVYAIANEVLSNGTFGIVKTVHQLDQPAPPMVVKIPRYDSTDNPEERQEIDA